MEFRILGPIEVRDGAGVTPLPRRRERALLAALVLRPGEVVSTDRLVEAIWGDSPPRTVVGSLQNAVSELRKALGPDVVVTRAPGYVLAVDPETIDAVRFEHAVRGAAALPASDRSEALAGALALWRGPALADLADEPFARVEATRLDELRLAAVEERIAADLELGRGADLVPELEAHVAANPLRERLQGQLMLALYRSGRQAEALEAYQDARRALVDGLGIDPSAALQELERRILRQDPALLAEEPARREAGVVGDAPTRKTITVLAAALDDVSEVDPEPLRARVDRFLAAVSDAAGHHEGVLDRFLGSEAVAVFGVPRSHEDDALRAARAAVEIREALSTAGDAVRVGIATGEALVGAADAPVVGDVVAVAVMLRDCATTGVILTSEPTYSLVRDAVVTGESLTVGSRELGARRLEAVRGARGRARRLDTPFVGRERELAALREALGRATAENSCVAVTVLGDAGIGKTRLAEELRATLVRGRVLRGQCRSYGAGAAFAPLLDIVRDAAGALTEGAVERLCGDDEDGRRAARQVVALAEPETVVPLGDAFWAVRRLLESLARDDPLVVVIDDLHWAEPTLLDLVDYLAQRIAAPVVLLCLARPELLSERPGWAGAASAVTLVTVSPLDDLEARTLLEHLGEELSETTRARILDRSDGNPLHLEQLTVYVTDEGGDPRLEEVPPTIEAVISSRIDRLPEDVRSTLQRAAVTQRVVRRDLLVALCEPGAPVDAALLELTRRGLLVPDPSGGPEDWYRFHHALVRDVAYGSLPKAVRAKLHERAAGWWVDRDEPPPDELVGWHLEQAHRFRAELRPDDPGLAALAEAAGERLATAGLRLAKAVDPATLDLLGRAAALLPDDRRRAAVLVELGAWLRVSGDPKGAQLAFERSARTAEASGDAALAARARIDLAWGEAAFQTTTSMTSFRELVLELLPTLEDAQDDRGLMRAWWFIGTTHLYDTQFTLLEHAARRAAAYADAAGWLPLSAVNSIGTALLHGPRPVPEALAEIGALQEEFRESRYLWASLAKSAAVLHATSLDDERADELLDASYEILVGTGDRLAVTTGWTPNRLMVLRQRGDRAAARDLLADWRRDLLELENDAYLATALVESAHAAVEEPSSDADRLLSEAAARASPDDRVVQALIRSTTARRRALDGESDEARRHADEAADLLSGSDALFDRARIEIDRARVLELTGDTKGTRAALRRAGRYLEEKGHTRALDAVGADGTLAVI